MKGLRRLAAAIAVAVVAAATVAVTAAPAAASALPIGDCTTTSGVILAVDFSHWGGPILRSCGTTPTTGDQLLNEGGWHTDGDEHDGPAFICRIGYSGFHAGAGYPTPQQEPCIDTPPASAYWSYWHADPGQNTWSYSQLGAMSYQPKPGSVDLWVFGQTNIAGTVGSGVPTFSPDTLRAHNSAPIGGAPTKKPNPTPAHPTATATRTAPAHGQTTTKTQSIGGTDSVTRTPAVPVMPSCTKAPTPSASSPQLSAAAVAALAAVAAVVAAAEPVTSRLLAAAMAAVAAAAAAGVIAVEPVTPLPPTCGATRSPVSHPPVVDAPPVSAPSRVHHGSATPAIITLIIVILLGAAGAVVALRRPRRDG